MTRTSSSVGDVCFLPDSIGIQGFQRLSPTIRVRMKWVILLPILLTMFAVSSARGEPVISMTTVNYLHRKADPAYPFFPFTEQWCIFAEMHLTGDGYDPPTTNTHLEWDMNSVPLEYQGWLNVGLGLNSYFKSLTCADSPLNLGSWERDYTFRVEGGPSKANNVPPGTYFEMPLAVASWDPDSCILSWDSVEQAHLYYVWIHDATNGEVVRAINVGLDTSCEIASAETPLEFPPYLVGVQALHYDSEPKLINQSEYFTFVFEGTEESESAGNCSDGIDNDCDGLIDTDPQCCVSGPCAPCD